MLSNIIARRYAGALFRLAKAKELIEQTKDELNYLNQLYQTEKDLRQVLNHPLINREKKLNLLHQLLKGKTGSITLRFLELLIRKNRLKHLPALVELYNELSDQAKGIIRVEVKSFLTLTKQEQTLLRQRLSRTDTKEVILKTKIDRSLLGGLTVQIGDTVFDGSVRNKLKNLQEYLLNQTSAV